MQDIVRNQKECENKIQIQREDLITANYLANLRKPYEFRRRGYEYETIPATGESINKMFGSELITTSSNIVYGLLAELLVYRDLTEKLYASIEGQDNQKQAKMIQEEFIYSIRIGQYDQGYDFVKKIDCNENLLVDIKCYASRITKNKEEIDKYNIYVDQEQFDANKGKKIVYIQTFILQEDSKLFLYVGGYAMSNELVFDSECKIPAYRIKIRDARSYNELIKNFFIKDID